MRLTVRIFFIITCCTIVFPLLPVLAGENASTPVTPSEAKPSAAQSPAGPVVPVEPAKEPATLQGQPLPGAPLSQDKSKPPIQTPKEKSPAQSSSQPPNKPGPQQISKDQPSSQGPSSVAKPGSTATAQPPASVSPAKPQPPSVQGQQAPAVGYDPQKKTYSLYFDDVDIYSVIHTIFGEVLKVDYVVDPRVKGRASFKSISMIPRDNILSVMEVILRLNGVAVVEDSNLYKVLPISEIAREPSSISYGRDQKVIPRSGKGLLQVIPIHHIQSSEMVRLLSPFLSAHASVVDVPKTNHIVIADTDANVKRILNLVEIFDSEQQKKKGPQVFVYPVQHSKAKDIAGLLQQIFLNAKPQDRSMSRAGSQPQRSNTPASPTQPGIQTASAAVPQPVKTPAPDTQAPASQPQISLAASGSDALVSDIVKIFHDEIINSVIVVGTPEDFEVIKCAIRMIDIVPRQVLIEGVIAEISLTDKLSLGLRWAINARIFGTNTDITLNKGNADQSSGLQLIGTDSSGNIQAMISALATQSKAKLLASPHIMVSDNREARIQVGQSVPIPTSEIYSTTSVSTQRTIQYKDIGIILTVKPQISDSGQVTLDISQEVSTFSTIILYANEQQIILNKTDAKTNLVVQDGQTIIIGGLIREDKSKAMTGIPFLSKIPVIGYLFGNTDKEDSRMELVILLTPRVVKGQKDTAALTSEYADKFVGTGAQKDIRKGDLIRENNGSKQEAIKHVN